MPIYEFKCKKCKKEFEYLVLGSNEDISCPECNTKKVARQMSACAFKSSGSYSPATGSSSGCSSCSGGSCSSCH